MRRAARRASVPVRASDCPEPGPPGSTATPSRPRPGSPQFNPAIQVLSSFHRQLQDRRNLFRCQFLRHKLRPGVGCTCYPPLAGPPLVCAEPPLCSTRKALPVLRLFCCCLRSKSRRSHSRRIARPRYQRHEGYRTLHYPLPWLRSVMTCWRPSTSCKISSSTPSAMTLSISPKSYAPRPRTAAPLFLCLPVQLLTTFPCSPGCCWVPVRGQVLGARKHRRSRFPSPRQRHRDPETPHPAAHQCSQRRDR